MLLMNVKYVIQRLLSRSVYLSGKYRVERKVRNVNFDLVGQLKGKRDKTNVMYFKHH